MMRRRTAAFLSPLMTIAIILILLTAGCFSPPGQRGPEGETKNRATEGLPSEKIVRVVATIFPLADIIKQIGGEAVEVATLLTPGSSPHTFEPTVEQARAVSEADLMVFVGGGLDNWAVKLGTAGEKTVLLEIMALLAKEEDSDAAFTDNPHIWVDPVLVKERIAPLICRALKSIYPDGAASFEENLKSFQQELDTLHKELSELTAAFSQKRFISFHSAWHYFARRYGLQEVASVEEFPGKEPSAKWLEELVKLADLHNIRVIFAEPQLGNRAAEVIADEIGGKVLLLDPLGGEGVPGRESYLELIRYNTEIFRQALQ